MKSHPILWFAVFLGIGVILALCYQTLTQTGNETPAGLDPVQKDYLEDVAYREMAKLKGPIAAFWVTHGRTPTGFDELLESGDIEPQLLRDPFRHRILWEQDAWGITLRSAGWDRIYHTLDDLTLFVPLR